MDELQYHSRRLVQEEAAARTANCHAARERHRELADAYRLRCLVLTKFSPFGICARPVSATEERNPSLASAHEDA